MKDTAKFREAIVHIANRCSEDKKFGAVKINKILYYSDFYAYRSLGRSITGAEYQHLSEGPAPRELLDVRADLIGDGSIEIQKRSYFNSVQHRIVAMRDADVGVFNEDEIAIMDEVIESLWDMNASQVSDMSHNEIGWRVTNEYETIPYRTAWLSTQPLQPLTPEQIEQGKAVAKRNGLLG